MKVSRQGLIKFINSDLHANYRNMGYIALNKQIKKALIILCNVAIQGGSASSVTESRNQAPFIF